MSSRIYLCVDVPDALVGEFLRAIRDFDMKHDPEHEDKIRVQMLTENDFPMERMLAVFQAVNPVPQFTYVKKFDS